MQCGKRKILSVQAKDNFIWCLKLQRPLSNKRIKQIEMYVDHSFLFKCNLFRYVIFDRFPLLQDIQSRRTLCFITSVHHRMCPVIWECKNGNQFKSYNITYLNSGTEINCQMSASGTASAILLSSEVDVNEIMRLLHSIFYPVLTLWLMRIYHQPSASLSIRGKG